MNQFQAYQIVTVAPHLFVFRELPYTFPGWAAIVSGAFLAIFGLIRWWLGLPRLTLAVFITGAAICAVLGVWLIGLEYTFSFERSQSVIDIHMSWFGRTVTDERLHYSTPPYADIVVTKRTTNQLVLRFADGKVKTLGLSTDREGHAEIANLINTFLRGGSILQ
jgi:hypothetical protein